MQLHGFLRHLPMEPGHADLRPCSFDLQTMRCARRMQRFMCIHSLPASMLDSS